MRIDGFFLNSASETDAALEIWQPLTALCKQASDLPKIRSSMQHGTWHAGSGVWIAA
jgi:hypothetical protein